MSHTGKINSLSHIRKRTILWVVLEKELNSLRHLFKKSSILWVILITKFNSLSLIKKFNSLSDILKKGFNSLRHIQEIKRFNSLRHIQEIKRFNSQKKSILWVIFDWWKNFESWKKRSISLNQKFSKKFKYLSHVNNKVQFFESCEKGPSIWIMKKKVGAILWVKLRKKEFNSLSHIFQLKKVQSFEWYPRRVQFFQFFGFLKKKKNSII